MVDGMEPPILALGPESGRVIAEIVASHKLADDIRAAGEADPLEVACDLLREANVRLGAVRLVCPCEDCAESFERFRCSISDFLANHGR